MSTTLTGHFSLCECHRLHVACACCRLKLTQKLKQQMDKAEGSTSLDLAKAAKLLTDVAVVESEADLSGIDVLEADEGFLRDAGQQVRAQAQVCHSRLPQAADIRLCTARHVGESAGLLGTAPSVNLTAASCRLWSDAAAMDSQLASGFVIA